MSGSDNPDETYKLILNGEELRHGPILYHQK